MKLPVLLEYITSAAGFVLRVWVKFVCEVLDNDTSQLTFTVSVEIMYTLLLLCMNVDDPCRC